MTCPQCGGDAYFLGALGLVRWWRCRDCGWEFHTKEPAGGCEGCGD